MSKCEKCGKVIFNGREHAIGDPTHIIFPDRKPEYCHCKGTGVEPEVELISATNWARDVYAKYLFRIPLSQFDLIIENARAVGAQEQKKVDFATKFTEAVNYGKYIQRQVDAGICRKEAKKENVKSTECRGSPYCGYHAQNRDMYLRAAKAIEDNK